MRSGLCVMTTLLIAVATRANSSPALGQSVSDEIRPFRIDVGQELLDDLALRLARARMPEAIPGTQWQYGVDQTYLRTLVEYWRDEYDWRAQEKRLNAFDQYKTRINGLDLHFIHQRSTHADATPLLLVHGWPGSVSEFSRIIPRLTQPERYGGSSEQAFHVVCPSLPGFAFSEAPRETGWTSARMAETFAVLMGRLGYTDYLAQGGDWGSGIVRWLADNDGDHCIGAHSNFPSAGPPREEPMRGVTPGQMERYQRRRAELADHKAYASIQGTRPGTLGYALNDSPVGLAAWIVDKFYAWSDHGGDLSRSFSHDDLLTNVMLYWVTESMPSATRIYFESRHRLPRPASMQPFESGSTRAPLGFALFPREINVPPRAWVQRSYGERMVHWTEMPRGGHFAALETPELLAEDIRKFLVVIRPSQE